MLRAAGLDLKAVTRRAVAVNAQHRFVTEAPAVRQSLAHLDGDHRRAWRRLTATAQPPLSLR